MTPAFAPPNQLALRRGKLLVATTNKNKLREIRPMLEGLDLELVTLADVAPVLEPEESGTTFWQNARIKAQAYAQATGLPTVAEDSGFEVDGLGGEPGVWSARFMGPSATYPERFTEIYRRLNGQPSAARFVTAMAVARGDELLFETEATIEGTVAGAPRGAHGFGYDPIFFYPPAGTTTAEMPDPVKAAVSHRGRAFRNLIRWIKRGAGPL